ncbi:MAG: hypothetical protein HOP08_06820 [Cyclobacteriaceae bacterium]|nr:hypothetical protein [Cyclobacteriaceae bacterium]
MKRKAFLRNLMLTGGILAAVIILFSQTFQAETRQFMSRIEASHAKKNAEKSREGEKKVVIAAPADAVTPGVAAEMEDNNPSLIREIFYSDNGELKLSTVSKKLVTDFFKTLFRVVISPQAP